MDFQRHKCDSLCVLSGLRVSCSNGSPYEKTQKPPSPQRQKWLSSGLLTNFNVKLVVKEGLSRIVNGFPDGSE
jgi:hypothetical protein